jgi:hypothetical protein
VKHRSFLYFALIASLVFGQIAASVHVVGHLGQPFDVETTQHGHHNHQHAHAFSNRVTHNHNTAYLAASQSSPRSLHTAQPAHNPLATAALSAPHEDNALKENALKNNAHNGDCAIYHAYIGASACLPELHLDAVVFSRARHRPPPITDRVVRLTTRAISIRGPPAAV